MKPAPLDEAIAAFRSLLITQPELVRVRLELARAFFLKEEDGQELWRDMIRRVRPSLIVVHGKLPFEALREALGGTEPKKCVLGRGASGRRTLGRRCTWTGGTLVGLPHLSRYAVVTSRRTAVRRLLDGFVIDGPG